MIFGADAIVRRALSEGAQGFMCLTRNNDAKNKRRMNLHSDDSVLNHLDTEFGIRCVISHVINDDHF